MRVVLGSASPARLKVLRDAGLDPEVLIADLDEDALLDGLGEVPPEARVVALAEAKAAELLPQLGSDADAVVFTCDSMLHIDGRLQGKPKTAQRARDRWRAMRGGTGDLLTGHCVTRLLPGDPARTVTGTVATRIRFAEVSDEIIDAYVATGEPLAVAGAFTLDGLGGWLIDGIDGDPSSVIGISLPLLRRLLADLDVDVTGLWR